MDLQRYGRDDHVAYSRLNNMNLMMLRRAFYPSLGCLIVTLSTLVIPLSYL